MAKKTTKRKSTSKVRRRKPSGSRKRRPALQVTRTQKALLSGLVLCFVAALLVLSLLSPYQGQLTASLSDLLWLAFGWGGVVVPLFLGAAGFYLVLWGMEQAPQLPRFRLLGGGLLFLALEAFASLMGLAVDNGLGSVWAVALARSGGGYLGSALAWGLLSAAGRVGALVVLAVVAAVAAVLAFGLTREEFGTLWQTVRGALQREQQQTVTAGDREIPVNVPEPAPAPEAAVSEAAPAQDNGSRRRRTKRKKEETDGEADGEAAPVFVDADALSSTTHWELPEMEKMLEAAGEQELSNAAIREQVEIIEETLHSFGAPARVVEINQGPTVTQFGVEPQFIEHRSGRRTKVKVGKIASLADDLALALAAHSVRVQAPVPGKGYVGVEVPNPQKALVSLSNVMESPAFKRIRSPLRIGLGQDVSGKAAAADLMKMPHLLVAGATGAGKSVCVNSLIACLLLQNTPEDLRMVMVDPKRVELTGYNGIPHLVAPVVVDMERVIGTLQWALREMDMRYQKLAEIGARNIVDYNKKIKGTDKQKMPFVVIIIDELADLMMVSPEETERSITRLAQMARATGIHMVIATQRPSVDVVTGLIKANFPARIAFAVASSTDSRVILDTTGAERLLGQGDMLFQSPDAGEPVRLQGSFVSDNELQRIIQYWRGARRFHRVTTADATKKEPAESPTTVPPPTQQPLWEDLIEQEKQSEYEDELVPEAIALVRELGKASTSLLQRRFRIGYTRAARIMDVMEAEEIIGPPTGTSKAREVLQPEPEAESGGEA